MSLIGLILICVAVAALAVPQLATVYGKVAVIFSIIALICFCLGIRGNISISQRSVPVIDSRLA